MRMVCWDAIARAAFCGARGFLLLGAGLVWLYGPTSPAQAQLANSAWPMAYHDLRHTGRSQYNGPLTADLRWVIESRPFIKGSPIIGPGDIIVGCGSSETIRE